MAPFLLCLVPELAKGVTIRLETGNARCVSRQRLCKTPGWFETGTQVTQPISMDTWTREEEAPPFKGLPPLPKVFLGAHLSQEPLPEMAEQEEAKPPEGDQISLHGKISWVQREMLRLRRRDQELFRHLYLLALEIQDLSELHQEMAIFSKEELTGEDANRAGGRKPTGQSQHEAAFELTI